MSKEQFVEIVTTDQPDAPEYFTFDALLNTKERPILETTMKRSLNPLTLEKVLELRRSGAQLLDVRESMEYEAAHLVGAINIGLGGTFATWAGTVLDREEPIVIIAGPGREEEAAMRLGRIGFDHVAGYLDNAMLALGTRPDLVTKIERVTALNLAEQLASAIPPLILDVRTVTEWRAKHIQGSVNIPLNHLRERLAELPKGGMIAVHCAGGYRSALAASLLLVHNRESVEDLVGGIAAWEAEKLPVVSSGATG